MKQMCNSFLQSVSRFVKARFVNVSGQILRSVGLMTAGVFLVTLLTLTAGDNSNGEGSAMIAHAETQAFVATQELQLEKSDQNGSEARQMNQADTGAYSVPMETMADESEVIADAEELTVTETEENVELTDDTNKKTDEEIMDEEFEAIPEQKEQAIWLSEDDREVLLRIVQAEAGGCDVKGRMLVANVILNRMENEEFPNTVRDVVYEKYQFSPVSNGSINTCKVTDETVEAVERALAGEDYSDGALYFMNRSRSSSRNVGWFDANLDYLFRHEDHEFFK